MSSATMKTFQTLSRIAPDRTGRNIRNSEVSRMQLSAYNRDLSAVSWIFLRDLAVWIGSGRSFNHQGMLNEKVVESDFIADSQSGIISQKYGRKYGGRL